MNHATETKTEVNALQNKPMVQKVKLNIAMTSPDMKLDQRFGLSSLKIDGNSATKKRN
ncbi:MAG: hypothetical protein ACI9BF_000241 [Candidatus Paceibacteria bacterium]|jgi:hypothetical protein